MTAPPGSADVETFRDLVAARLGLRIDESRLDVLADVLRRRTGDGDCSGYMARLADGSVSNADLQALARELTVTETFFFRGADQFAAFEKSALPDRLASAGARGVHILSAGCSSGEEPYSLAVALRETAPAAMARVAITAFDINPAALDKAARAKYSSWSLREASDRLRARWFMRDGDAYAIDPSIRRAVSFHARNLAADDPAFWQPDRFDIVFCRNVLMYFTPAQAQAAVRRIAHSIVPGGYLFLGHAETLRGVSSDFELCHTHGTFYYQRKDASTPRSPRRFAPALIDDGAPAADASWFEIIGRSTQRIHELLPAQSVVAAPTHAGEAAPPDLSRVLEHLHEERFERAIEQLATLPAAHEGDRDVLLLKAMSLCQAAAFDSAQAVCRDVLAQDALNAGAHYVLALCREGVGDADGALCHDRQAAYLDAAFAMPRLHQGLLAKRRGDYAAAVSDLNAAIALLQDEDPARVVLFGGGFRREALIALCRAECAACAVHS